MPAHVLAEAERMAKSVTDALGGYGLFGVEFFIQGETVYFSEVSPRPHDTGLVTLVSQDLSEFALHVRAILGLPIPGLHQLGPSASCALLAHGHGNQIQYRHIETALSQTDTHLRLFGKPEVRGERRVGVTLSRAETIAAAREKCRMACEAIEVVVA
jgi:phosphoribosylglycinamide formyltransferase 2